MAIQGAVIVQPEPDFKVGDDFCAYVEGVDSSRFWSELSMPPSRNTVEADTARNRGVRTIPSKQAATLSGAGFRDYQDAAGFTPYLESLFSSSKLSQVMLFPDTDEPSGAYGWAGRFFLTEQDGPASVGAANAVSVAGSSPQERNLIRSLLPFREFVDADMNVSGETVNNPDGATAFGGSGFLQIMALDVTGVASDVEFQVRHSNDAFGADNNLLKAFAAPGTSGNLFGTTDGNVGGKQTSYFLLGNDVTIEKDLRVDIVSTGVGTIDKLQCIVGFFRALSLVKP